MNLFDAPRYYFYRLTEKQERRDILNERLLPHARATDSDNIRAGFKGSILENLAVEIAELDGEIEELKKQYLNAREKVKKLLNRCKNPRAMLIIELHDLDLMEWSEISSRLYISLRHLKRMHARETEALRDMVPEGTVTEDEEDDAAL